MRRAVLLDADDGRLLASLPTDVQAAIAGWDVGVTPSWSVTVMRSGRDFKVSNLEVHVERDMIEVTSFGDVGARYVQGVMRTTASFDVEDVDLSLLQAWPENREEIEVDEHFDWGRLRLRAFVHSVSMRSHGGDGAMVVHCEAHVNGPVQWDEKETHLPAGRGVTLQEEKS